MDNTTPEQIERERDGLLTQRDSIRHFLGLDVSN